MLINTKRVKHEINLSGKSIAQIAKKLKTNEATVQSWINNDDAEVEYKFLLGLADLFKRPSYYFLIDDDPSGEYTGAFRTLYLQKISEGSLSPKLSLAIRRSGFIQEKYKELVEAKEDNIFYQMKDLVLNGTEIDPIKVAKILNIKYGYLKRTFPDNGEVYRIWRRAIEERNILITQFDYSTAKARGFCIHDKSIPIININSTEPNTARLFTLLHELGHIIFGNSDITDMLDLIESDNSEEARCNRFASSILIPQEYLLEKISEYTYPDGEIDIVGISKAFGVSRHAMVIALSRDGYLSEENSSLLINELEKEYQEYRNSLDRKTEKYRIPFATTRTSAIGETYIETVREKYNTNEISHADAYDLISLDWNIKPTTFQGLMTL